MFVIKHADAIDDSLVAIEVMQVLVLTRRFQSRCVQGHACQLKNMKAPEAFELHLGRVMTLSLIHISEPTRPY